MARVVAALAAATLLAGCSGGGKAAAPTTTGDAPTTTAPAATTTSAPPPTTASGPTTTGTPRTTVPTSVVIGPGDARLGGTVSGPQGLVDGATVRVERVVGKDVATTNVTTAGGSWHLDSILGGSYRVRAYKVPDLAQAQPEVFFLAANDNKTLDLKMDSYAGDKISASVKPNPPIVEQAALLTITIGTGRVDDQGRPSVAPRPGVRLKVTVALPLVLESAAESVTGSDGSAGFTFRCAAPGTGNVTLTINGGATSVPVPACATGPPPPTTRG